uniref:Uncharacterized protein n=1 Tax=Arundo donax TaxID=35708 RepID=A0A0A8Z2Y1_ARUDO
MVIVGQCCIANV